MTFDCERTIAALREDLSRDGTEVIETHISWVFRRGRDVWKIKKPVSLGFLDFSTPALRRRACEAEVRLNARLAPGVYRGVVPITLDGDGRYSLTGDGEPVDWAVHMIRLPDGGRADLRLLDGRLTFDDLERIAERIARFHDSGRCDEGTAGYGSIDVIGRNVRENFDQTRGSISAHLRPEEASEIEGWQTSFLDHHLARFEERIHQRRIREGHGDLRLEHVYLFGDEIVVIDCIEFNERFRIADVCADVAFLSMDLAWHGRVDCAEYFLSAYARASQDYGLYPLVDFYESYRAYVRGKVASMFAADRATARPTRDRAAREARRFYLLALASERAPLVAPSVIAVGGVIGAGKTTIAQAVGQAVGGPVIDTDRTRKHMLGITPGTPVRVEPWRGAYAVEFTDTVYGEVLARAESVLASGRSVVIDASFRLERHRDAFRQLARRYDVPFRFVECRAPAAVCRARLRDRERVGGPSDGRLEIFDEFVAQWQPVRQDGESEYISVDTSRPLLETLSAVRECVRTWPPGLTQ